MIVHVTLVVLLLPELLSTLLAVVRSFAGVSIQVALQTVLHGERAGTYVASELFLGAMFPF